MVATLIHLFRHSGVPLSDIKRFLLHALLLLVKFRRYASAKICQTSYGQEIWVLVAVMAATRTLIGFKLEVWNAEICARSRDSSRHRVQVGDTASWIWPTHTLRSYEDCFLRAVGSEVYISPQEFQQAELSLRALGFFERCSFDDHIQRWIIGESKVMVKSWVLVLDQDSYRDTNGQDSTDGENDDDVEDENPVCETEQREEPLCPRRDSMMSSSTWPVEIITGDEGATWKPRSRRDSIGCEL